MVNRDAENSVNRAGSNVNDAFSCFLDDKEGDEGVEAGKDAKNVVGVADGDLAMDFRV